MNELGKLERKRLIIFLILAFTLFWVFELVNVITKGNTFLKNIPFCYIGMWTPLIAVLITRAVTKEGWAIKGKDSLLLTFSFKRKWKYLVLAVVVSLAYLELGKALLWAVYPNLMSTPSMRSAVGMTNERLVALLFKGIGVGILFSLVAIGEEVGWRGYMIPKLNKKMNLPKAVIVGGIIWGLWHIPEVCIGTNMGRNYPGYPFVGIAVTCIVGVFMCAILTYFTEKSESIWPAAIIHGINNTNPGILRFCINQREYSKIDMLMSYLITSVPIIVLGIIALVLIIREQKQS